MKNFATHVWTRFTGDFKEHVAFVTPGEKAPETTTYWEWTRRIQKLAIGLMEEGFESGMRIGIAARNSRDWLDLAFAAWMAGGCVVPLVPGRDRRETLRCLARTGAEWIATHDEAALRELRGQGDKLPPHLKWVSFAELKATKIDNVFDLKTLEEKGRYRAQRGAMKDLAKRSFELPANSPALILFELEPGDDPHGALFNGGKLSVLLEYLGGDLLFDDDDERVAILLSFGWFYGLLTALATLLQGKTLAMASSLTELGESFPSLRPTTLICGPATIEGHTLEWRERVEAAPQFMKSDESSGFSLSTALGKLGEKASRLALYDPIRADMGGELRRIYLAGGTAPDEVLDILENASMPVLGIWGVPEAGISHLERVGARRRHSVGRPVQGYVCKLDGTKGDEAGEVMLRADVLFDGYWDESGPREMRDAYLATGIEGRLESGFLFV